MGLDDYGASQTESLKRLLVNATKDYLSSIHQKGANANLGQYFYARPIVDIVMQANIPLHRIDDIEIQEDIFKSPVSHNDVSIGCTPIITIVNAEFLEYLKNNPNAFTTLSPEQFENVICHVLENQGLVVEKVGRWNQPDGGVDIVAIQKSCEIGDIKIAVQCKIGKNRISAVPIRALHGVLDRFKAHKGIIMTSYEFTANAYKEAAAHFWKISLEDRNKIIARLKSIFGE